MLCAQDCEVMRMKAAKAKISERVRCVNEDTAGCRIRWETTGREQTARYCRPPYQHNPFRAQFPSYVPGGGV